ncbi:50S ribosomal protein L25 [Paenibacillus sp. GCM10012307]|uniref:Large ribosomal subunit protein bL25 n=1 Tax=Paenibacillus roseus TaxID=2798579 RepID=A0A934J6H2_9BACL|nr:50S ribosomal protein L25 [Paenibacillus roseus]MBJ6361282.1 50S ribosomal protein L25 [Paenibacillus roseus]
MSTMLQVERRQSKTKGELRKLRQEGKIPGVIYGKQVKESTPLSVDEKQVLHILRHHPNAVLEIQVPSGGTQPVMLGELQRHPISKHIIHIDFHQINMNEKVKTSVRVELSGDAPGAKEGGILQILQHEIEIQCLPSRIPESVVVDVSHLQIGENVLLDHLKLPEGVEARADSDLVIVTILAPQKELSEAEAVEEEKAIDAAEKRSEEAKMEDISTSL